MFEFTAQMLRRVLALLALTGALTQSAPADLDAVRSSQFPWYASLTQAEGRFDDSMYLASNAVIFLERHDGTDGALSCPYILADLYIPDVHSLRAWYADDPSISGNEPSEIRDAVRAVNAAFAVNGDFYIKQGVTAIRNGTILNSCVSGYDLCVLYEDGSMRCFRGWELSTQDEVNEALRGAWQAWSFGPILLNEDGSAVTDFTDRTIEYLTQEHPRTALGYYAPGHYCLLSVSGYQESQIGVSLEELSAFFASLGCRSAYNLDGGTSTHVWYHGREIGFPSQPVRLADLIYLEDLSSVG